MIDLPWFCVLIISNDSDIETLARESCLQTYIPLNPQSRQGKKGTGSGRIACLLKRSSDDVTRQARL